MGVYSSKPLSPVQLQESVQSDVKLLLLDISRALARLTG